MESPLTDYETSSTFEEDVVIHHHEEFYACRFECGKTFVEICMDMGLDKDGTQISLL